MQISKRDSSHRYRLGDKILGEEHFQGLKEALQFKLPLKLPLQCCGKMDESNNWVDIRVEKTRGNYSIIAVCIN